MQEMWVWSLGQEDPLEEEMATHCGILVWKIAWTEEPGRLHSMRLQRVRHNLATKHTHTHTHTHTHILGNNSHALYSQSASKMFTGTKLKVLRWGNSHGQSWEMAWRKKRGWEKQARPSIKFQCKCQCRLWLGLEPVEKNAVHAEYVGDHIYRKDAVSGISLSDWKYLVFPGNRFQIWILPTL